MGNEPDAFTVKSFYWKAFSEYIDAIDELTELFSCGKSPDQETLTSSVGHMVRKREKMATLVKIAEYKYKIKLEPGMLPFNALGGIC